MQLRRPVGLLVAVAAVLFCGRASADDWPLVRRDPLSDGVAQSTLPEKLETRWTYSVGDDAGFEATPIVVDGTIYVGDTAGTFHAVRLADGALVWKKDFDESSFLAGAAYHEQRLFVGDGNGAVRCLSSVDGSEIWNASVDAEVYAGPMVVDGRVLVACEAGVLTSFDAATGEKQWAFQIDAPLRCTPTTIDGRTLLAGCDSKLHVIDIATGMQLSTANIDAPTGATAGVRDRHAYFGTEGGTFYAIKLPATADELPEVAWTYRDPARGQPIRAAAAVGESVVVYGSQGKGVYALDRATGKERWKLATRSRVDSSPVLAGDQVVAATDRGMVYVVDVATGEAKWQFEAGGGFAASPAVVAGCIVIGNTDGTLYCFGAANGEKELATKATENTKGK